MKRIIHFIFIFSIIVYLCYVCIKPVILFLVKEQLRKVFIDSEVSIDDCDVSLLRKIALLNIGIKKEHVYDIQIKQVAVQYGPFSIVKGNILKVSLNEAIININLPEESIQNFKSHLNFGGSGSVFALDLVELSNARFNISSKELKIKATVSLVFQASNQLLHSFDLKIDSFVSGGFQLEDASLEVRRDDQYGFCYIDRIKYSDVTVRQVSGKARLEDEFLVFDFLSALTLGGETKGSARLSMDNKLNYMVNLRFIQLDLDAITNDFKLKEKVQLQGKLNGSIELSGSGANLEAIEGDMSGGEEGGLLTVKDDAYLDYLARSTNQSLDIIVKSFKDYHFNASLLRLFLQNGNLVFDIGLDGESGKRNLVLTIHDFKLGGRKE